MGIQKLMDSIAVSGATTTSIAIDVGSLKGYFSIQYSVSATAAPELEFGYKLSNNKSTFLTPSEGAAIASSIKKTSGPGGNGKDIVSFTPPPAQYMKLYATESSGASATVDLWLFSE